MVRTLKFQSIGATLITPTFSRQSQGCIAATETTTKYCHITPLVGKSSALHAWWPCRVRGRHKGACDSRQNHQRFHYHRHHLANKYVVPAKLLAHVIRCEVWRGRETRECSQQGRNTRAKRKNEKKRESRVSWMSQYSKRGDPIIYSTQELRWIWGIPEYRFEQYERKSRSYPHLSYLPFFFGLTFGSCHIVGDF